MQFDSVLFSIFHWFKIPLPSPSLSLLLNPLNHLPIPPSYSQTPFFSSPISLTYSQIPSFSSLSLLPTQTRSTLLLLPTFKPPYFSSLPPNYSPSHPYYRTTFLLFPTHKTPSFSSLLQNHSPSSPYSKTKPYHWTVCHIVISLAWKTAQFEILQVNPNILWSCPLSTIYQYFWEIQILNGNSRKCGKKRSCRVECLTGERMEKL